MPLELTFHKTGIDTEGIYSNSYNLCMFLGFVPCWKWLFLGLGILKGQVYHPVSKYFDDIFYIFSHFTHLYHTFC